MARPLQYVRGRWPFRDLVVATEAPVLIPRPETEQLASLASATLAWRLAALPRSNTPPSTLQVLDIGCGSGVLSLSLLADARMEANAGRLHLTAVDASAAAVALTARNAASLSLKTRGGSYATASCACGGEPGVALCIVHGDALHGRGDNGVVEVTTENPAAAPAVAATLPVNPFAPPPAMLDHGPFDMLVSNPPYIACSDVRSLPESVAQWEDMAALAGGPPLGAGFTLRMLAQAASHRWLRDGADILLELDSLQPALLLDVLCADAGARARARARTQTASGFAAPAVPPRLTRAWALNHDWWPRQIAAGDAPILKADAIAAASAAWRKAVKEWGFLGASYAFKRAFTDNSGRLRFVHLTAHRAAA